MAKTTTKPAPAEGPRTFEQKRDDLAMDYARRLWAVLREKDLAAVGHHLRNDTLASFLQSRGLSAAVEFLRLTRPGGITADLADKDIADNYLTVPSDVEPPPSALVDELRELAAKWEKGPGRPFAAPRNPDHAPSAFYR